jgi:alpha-tubulin suppressor-like RCC1 family protein
VCGPKVYAWGKNKYGQLGLGHTNNMSTPTSILPLSDPLNPKNVRCIAAGKSHSAIIAEDGDVYTWGRGWDGQLGHDVVTEIELEPRIVPEMENRASASAACGRAHTVVITDNGNVWSWGDNKCGQLGLGNLNSTSTPKLVKSLEEQEATHVACGADHTVVITIANEVYGFGNGVYDQLGLGTLGLFPQPQRIPGLTVRSVAK